MWRSRRRRRDRSLACAEIVELVTDYLEGALPPGARAQVEAHLAGCDGCAEYLQQIVRTSGLLRAATLANGEATVTLSDDAGATLTEAFRERVANWSDPDDRQAN